MSKICVIGGMAMDVEGASFETVVRGESNPGSVHTNHGGVGRNITENLARLGTDVGLISVIGNDDPGRLLMRHLIALNVNVDGIQVISGERTAMYISILEADGSIDVAIAGMDILDRIDSDYIAGAWKTIIKSEMIVLDANLPLETLEYVLHAIDGKIPTFVDAVSAKKAEKLQNLAGRFTTIKANCNEAAAISGMPVTNLEEVKAAAKSMIKKGTKNVLITMGKDGVYYATEKETGIIPAVPVEKLVSTTGAGDAFSAMTIYGMSEGWSLRESAKFGVAASNLVVQSEGPVSEEMSLENVRAIVENIK